MKQISIRESTTNDPTLSALSQDGLIHQRVTSTTLQLFIGSYYDELTIENGIIMNARECVHWTNIGKDIENVILIYLNLNNQENLLQMFNG